MALQQPTNLRYSVVSLASLYIGIWIIAQTPLLSLPVTTVPQGTLTLGLPAILATIIISDVARRSPTFGGIVLGGLATITLALASWGLLTYYLGGASSVGLAAVLTMFAAIPLSILVLGRIGWHLTGVDLVADSSLRR